MLIFDKKFDIDRIRQFSSEWENLSQDDQQTILQMFDNRESIEFYCGLLCGFAGVYQLLYQPIAGSVNFSDESVKSVIGGSIAHIAKLIKDRIE
jgi:hypothetical protein